MVKSDTDIACLLRLCLFLVTQIQKATVQQQLVPLCAWRVDHGLNSTYSLLLQRNLEPYPDKNQTD